MYEETEDQPELNLRPQPKGMQKPKPLGCPLVAERLLELLEVNINCVISFETAFPDNKLCVSG